MTADWIVYTCLFLGLMTALVAGGFQIFSEFIMRSLMRTSPAGAIEAMQHINRTVYRTVFLVSFMLMVPISIGFAIYAGLSLSGLPRTLITLAAVIYIPGAFLVTGFGNVPMNERLEKLDHASFEAQAYWEIYGRVWTRWNHVRTLACIATAGCYLLAAIALVS